MSGGGCAGDGGPLVLFLLLSVRVPIFLFLPFMTIPQGVSIPCDMPQPQPWVPVIVIVITAIAIPSAV